MTERKAIDVGCGIIRRKGQILIAQRRYGANLGGYWEFPGGKRNEGETMEACLIREIDEELGVAVKPAGEFCIRYHEYPERILKLYFYFCDWLFGNPVRRDCLDYKWVKPEELCRFLFPPADRDVIKELVQKKRFYFRNGPFL